MATPACTTPEAPWGDPLRRLDGFDIAIAPLAHASGALAGAVCYGVAQAVDVKRRRATRSTA
jgi:hypothetical protein